MSRFTRAQFVVDGTFVVAPPGGEGFADGIYFEAIGSTPAIDRFFVRRSGVFIVPTAVQVKRSGTWISAIATFTKAGGVWGQVWPSTTSGSRGFSNGFSTGFN